MEKCFLRLKDLENISSENFDIKPIMEEVLNYKNYWLGRKFVFKNKASIAINMINEARLIDPNKVKLNPKCDIKLPNNIDNITFRAMMELKSTIGNSDPNNLTNTIARIISIVCFQENNFDKNGNKIPYSSDSSIFLNFQDKILNSYLWDMIGIYNWINESEENSKQLWNKRFMSVLVEDSDFEAAGASTLNQFNVIKTIKTLCKCFNIPYNDAWQLSYALSQTNSYEIATSNFVKDKLRVIKESKLKKKNKSS